MIIEYAQSKAVRPRKWLRIVQVAATLLLMALLAFMGIAGPHINAMYAPWNMTRQAFDSAATFGPWQADGEYEVRTYRLETSHAVITGLDTSEHVRLGQAALGRVQLKTHVIVEALGLALIVPLVLIWLIPWVIWRMVAWARSERSAGVGG